MLDTEEGQWLLPPAAKKQDGTGKNWIARLFAELCCKGYCQYTAKRTARMSDAYASGNGPRQVSPFVAFLTAAMGPVKLNRAKSQDGLAQELIKAHKSALEPDP